MTNFKLIANNSITVTLVVYLQMAVWLYKKNESSENITLYIVEVMRLKNKGTNIIPIESTIDAYSHSSCLTLMHY